MNTTTIMSKKEDQARVYLFNKPYQVLCQFTDEQGRQTLRDYIHIKDIYCAGRLDRDSEGLLLLTNHGALQHLISHPKHKLEKTYWVQVEGAISNTQLQQLANGVSLKDGPTLPCTVKQIQKPTLWPRVPPVRYRAAIPTSWIEINLREGRNRQIRRMTAAVGCPTLRLIRVAIGPWQLNGLLPGEYRSANLELDQIPASWRHYLLHPPHDPVGQRGSRRANQAITSQGPKTKIAKIKRKRPKKKRAAPDPISDK